MMQGELIPVFMNGRTRELSSDERGGSRESHRISNIKRFCLLRK